LERCPSDSELADAADKEDAFDLLSGQNLFYIILAAVTLLILIIVLIIVCFVRKYKENAAKVDTRNASNTVIRRSRDDQEQNKDETELSRAKSVE